MSDPEANTEFELTFAEAAELGFRMHTGRKFKEAELIYRGLLNVEPDEPNVTHYLGVLMQQTGRPAEALDLIECSLAADDSVAAWHNNYGNVLLDAGRPDEAAAAYRRCTALDPGNIEVLSNLGLLYRHLKQYEEAEKALIQALQAQPDFVTAHLNLSTLYWQWGRLEDAHRQTLAALLLFPRNGRVRQMLAHTYVQLGRLDDAAQVYREWVELEPENPAARHHLAGCTGIDVPERADDQYVEALFDRFAGTFDAKLTALEYRAPAFVGEAVARLLPRPERRMRILDAGCGTGLCGPYLAPYARALVGVDLSVNMIELARARNLYTDLVKAELVDYLEHVSDPFDVIVSADTLCYFGRLDAMAAGARRALHDGGVLAFTVEAHRDDADYRLHTHGRYSHSAAYIRRVLTQAGFTVREVADVILRSESKQPVAGFCVAAEAVPTAAAG